MPTSATDTLRERLEKWADDEEPYVKNGAMYMLDLLWPVIEAAGYAADQYTSKAKKQELCAKALAELEEELK